MIAVSGQCSKSAAHTLPASLLGSAKKLELSKSEKTMSWFLMALKKYAEFSGRSRRSEYWFFILFYILIAIALAFVDGAMGAATGFGVLSGIFALAMFIPSLAVTVRRLHDTDRSGWWILIGFIPLIGTIVMFVFMVLDSTGPNRFGPNPKEVA